MTETANGLNCLIRAASPGDVPVLAQIYRDSILAVGPSRYSRTQVAAWASFADDPGAFGVWIEGARTLVAVDADGTLAGFGGLEAPARISALFVAPAFMRRRVGSTLLSRLLATAAARGDREIVTQASEFSRPVFEQAGFTVGEVEHARFKGVDFTRYVMHRSLA